MNENKERIIVSMTSYPKRIMNVSKSIFFLLSKQTLQPDEIHLWLAETEFPNKEKDLPNDLQTILNHEKVFLHWLQKNTYCHKRHEIFNQTNENDLVFFVDDDVKYNDKLFENVLDAHKKYPNAVINYNWYSEHLYNGKKIIYGNYGKYKTPSIRVRWCGQSMIPSKLYPKEVLSKENIIVRDRICPMCDESWLTPWLVNKNVEIYCLKMGWGENISSTINKNDGLIKYTHEKESNGLERRDNWLFSVLSNYNQLLEKYKSLFNYGK